MIARCDLKDRMPVTKPPELSPAGILAEYRRLSPPDIRQQAELFRRMPNSEQRELLFYMIAHVTKGMNMLAAKVDPNFSLASADMEGATKQ